MKTNITRTRFACSLATVAAASLLSACASTSGSDASKEGSYERPEYTTGSNLARKGKDAGRLPDNVKLVDKEVFQAGLPGAAGAGTTAGGKN